MKWTGRGKLAVAVAVLLCVVEAQLDTVKSGGSQQGAVRGRLCCGAAADCAGRPPPPTSPPVFADLSANSSMAQESLEWRYYDLKCPWGLKKTYYALSNDSNDDSRLYVEEDKVRFRWKEEFPKFSSEYCVETLSSGQHQAVICRPNKDQLCSNATCISKCCEEGETLSFFDGCIPSNRTFSPEYRTLGGDPISAPPHPRVFSKIPQCDTLFTWLNPSRNPEDVFYRLQNGKMYDHKFQEQHAVEHYCIDYLIEADTEVAFLCREPLSEALRIKGILQAAGLVVSAVFLAVVVVLYLAVKELRDVQGLCLLSHVVALLLTCCCLFITHVFAKEMHPSHCVANAIILQFFFLAAFFWLNVMCFDVWRVIRGTVHAVPLSGILANDRRQFQVYSAYAWGLPLLITVVTAALHAAPDTPATAGILRPGFGAVSCWYSGDMEILAYFYGVISVLFVINLLLLGYVILLLYRTGAICQCCTKQVEMITAFNRHHLEAFWYRFSLFAVMAVCWVTEVLSWKIPPKELWIPTDIINSLQGLFVFVIFMCSKKKRNLVKKGINEIISRVSSSARKLSLSTETTHGVTFHANVSSLTNSSSDQLQQQVTLPK